MCGALKDAQVANPIWRCADARAAIATLVAEDGFTSMRHTAFVLLDLNMPDRGGLELLHAFRRHERRTPLIMLSTNATAEDAAFCYRAGANGFLGKPAEYGVWKDLAAKLATYWLKLAVLPYARACAHPAQAQRCSVVRMPSPVSRLADNRHCVPVAKSAPHKQRTP